MERHRYLPARVALLVVFAALVLGACAAGENPATGVPDAGGDLAGLWLGLWHGMILPITFVVSLFSDSVSVYEIHNSGNWYDLGFAFGAIVIAGASHGARSAAR